MRINRLIQKIPGQAANVKFCGMTDEQVVKQAVALAVDALGFILVPFSARYVSLEKAIALAKLVPDPIVRVAVVVNPSFDLLVQIKESQCFDVIQFHGNESAEIMQKAPLPYMRALSMAPNMNIIEKMQAYEGAQGFLLDTHDLYQAGGTGRTFDWQKIPINIRQSIVLAGGLNSQNIQTALTQVKPMALDINSGIESSPGCKDLVKMIEIMNIIRAHPYATST